MFKSVISQGHSLLFCSDELIMDQALENQCPEIARDVLVFKLLKTYFQTQDGEALAEFKAIELHEEMLPHLSRTLEFEIDEASLQVLIHEAIRTSSLEVFDAYCGQQLYIQTLQTMLSNRIPWDSS